MLCGFVAPCAENGANNDIKDAKKNNGASRGDLVGPIRNENVEEGDADGEQDKENATDAAEGHFEGTEKFRFDEFEPSEGGEDDDGVHTVQNRFNFDNDGKVEHDKDTGGQDEEGDRGPRRLKARRLPRQYRRQFSFFRQGR